MVVVIVFLILETFMPFFIKAVLIVLFLINQMSCTANLREQPKNLLDEELTQFQNIYNYGEAKFQAGELILKSTGNWFFTTKKKYRDFILTAEIKMPDVKEYSNSGIMFRGEPKLGKNGIEAMGYQAEVDPSARKWSGGFYDQGRRKWLNPLHDTRSNPDEDFVKIFYLNGQ